MFEPDERGVSPVVGVLLVVAITLLMGVSVAWSVGAFEAELSETQAEGVIDGQTAGPAGVQPVESEIIYPLDDSAGAVTTHVVVLPITDDNVGNSLNGVTVSYTATNASGAGASDIVLAGFDDDADGRIETDWRGDVEDGDVGPTNGGQAFTVEVTGNYDLTDSHRLVLAVRSVRNPASGGSYAVSVAVNDEQTYTGTLEIG